MAVAGKDRWWRRLFGKGSASALDPARTDLVVVASCFDDAEAASTTLDRAEGTDPTWARDDQVVLRHHLVLPADTIDDAIAVAAQDGYSTPESGPPPAELSSTSAPVEDGRPLVLQRVQVLDALHCSQERSRMAGLAQRRGGTVSGWDALQPAVTGEQ
ncbi:hypothetical protein GCM10007304_19080 [Rhodococcoides trifolii]|uniref:Uncharacterized protein n=1 Tax=Rhodococcoides trifolii TaxID=908250 RepID=A0A917FV03_9NOCA|nr:hypothetical protein [Rhodococcus trifolii]GGG05187.1 hypothetical protein GCM10007304_19080 [Rhodococcus trifolii]